MNSIAYDAEPIGSSSSGPNSCGVLLEVCAVPANALPAVKHVFLVPPSMSFISIVPAVFAAEVVSVSPVKSPSSTVTVIVTLPASDCPVKLLSPFLRSSVPNGTG